MGSPMKWNSIWCCSQSQKNCQLLSRWNKMSKPRTPPACGKSRDKDQTGISFRKPFTRPSMYLIGVHVNGYRDCWLSMCNSNFPGLVPTYNFCGDFLLGLKEFSKLQLQAGSKQIHVHGIKNQSAWLLKFILWRIGFGHNQLPIAETLILTDECVPGCGQWRQTKWLPA